MFTYTSNYPDIWYPLNNKQYKPCNSILLLIMNQNHNDILNYTINWLINVD